MSNVELPTWIWDLLADLVDEDAVHPKLYQFEAGAKPSFRPWDWCPAVALARVPEDMLRIAEHIAKYRREVAT